MVRYKQILEIVEEKQPRTILEVGTHKATRPVEWADKCHFKYYGFDVFEEGDSELFKREMNGKGASTMKYAKDRLDQAGIVHELYKGLSTDTLPKFTESFEGGIDLAFIDGGHATETIKQDFENVKKVMNKGGVIIFDDYYIPPVKGFGCNFLTEGEILDKGDKVGKLSIFLVRYDIKGE